MDALAVVQFIAAPAAGGNPGMFAAQSCSDDDQPQHHTRLQASADVHGRHRRRFMSGLHWQCWSPVSTGLRMAPRATPEVLNTNDMSPHCEVGFASRCWFMAQSASGASVGRGGGRGGGGGGGVSEPAAVQGRENVL